MIMKGNFELRNGVIPIFKRLWNEYIALTLSKLTSYSFCSNQDTRGYEELSAPNFIQTVTPPSLDDKAYEEFKFSRLQPRKDQDFPFDSHGKSLKHMFIENQCFCKIFL